MRARLPTTTVHRLISSPLGALLDTPTFERLKQERLPAELRLARIAAAANLTAEAGAEALLAALGTEIELGLPLRRRIERGLERFARAQKARDALLGRWERAFWDEGAWPPPRREELVALELERRLRSGHCLSPGPWLGFLAREEAIPVVGFAAPSPGELAARWARELADPSRLYAAPAEMPAIERSRSIPGPSGPEYLIRFRSPSRLSDVVHARVYEPEVPVPGAATLIWGGALFVACDQLAYWPEEEYVGRSLAARGHRVVLPEAPWHGRRAPAGHYSGEWCVATAPEGLFRLHAAAMQEAAVLVQWARDAGSRVVGVGGIDLGALVALHLAGRASAFPRGMRPDAVFLATAACHLDEIFLRGLLARTIGLDLAIPAAGWTEEALSALRDLLDPPPSPGIPPDRVVAVLGRRDEFFPCRLGRELLRDWRVPDENVTVLDAGHYGVLMHLLRRSDAQLAIARTLHRVMRVRVAA
jgi:hypothetical protein